MDILRHRAESSSDWRHPPPSGRYPFCFIEPSPASSPYVRMNIAVAALESRVQSLDHSRVDARVETICQLGCQEVRRAIAALEAGAELPETRGLAPDERALLLAELGQIMAVYGDACRIA